VDQFNSNCPRKPSWSLDCELAVVKDAGADADAQDDEEIDHCLFGNVFRRLLVKLDGFDLESVDDEVGGENFRSE